MNSTRKKHQLLRILAIHNANVQSGKTKPGVLGISYEELYLKLNVKDDQLVLICAELFNNEEIGYHDAHGVRGLYAKNKGISAFSTKKYLRRYRKSMIDNVKDMVQIVIPILSLVLAILAITLKIENYKFENEKEIKQLESRLDALESKKPNKISEIKIETAGNRR